MKNYFTLTALSLLASCLITLPTPTSAAPATPTSTPQLADMGGRLIELKPYARDVEFNETQRGGVPKIRSFGFYLQYPELIPSPTGNIARNYISVGVNTGDYYPNDDFMNNRFRALLTKNTINPLKNYEKLPLKQYGLDVYAPIGIDPKTNTPLRNHPDSYDVYVKMSSTGSITEIECSNRQVPHPPCRQHFSLSPHSKAWVYVSYQRVHLPQWESIQKNVQQLLLNSATPH